LQKIAIDTAREIGKDTGKKAGEYPAGASRNRGRTMADGTTIKTELLEGIETTATAQNFSIAPGSRSVSRAPLKEQLDALDRIEARQVAQAGTFTATRLRFTEPL